MTLHKQDMGWKRLRREILRVIIVLALLEAVTRIGPIKSFLEDRLGPYENLLWYYENMPVYRDQLLHGPHYNVWLGGSSYMMTSLQPKWIQREVVDDGIDDLTFQNYGFNTMQNLDDMAIVYDRWMFQMDQPQYMVIGSSVFNFTTGAKLQSKARSSPMERTYIFPDSIDEYIGGWLFQNSTLYHYSLLLRNATFIPREQAMLKSMPLGGFSEFTNSFTDCNPNAWIPANRPLGQFPSLDFSSLDHFIAVIRERRIPVAVVNIPMQYCSFRNSFANYQDYADSYLEPLKQHLHDIGIPFHDLDSRFQSEVPEDEQNTYFRDLNHPNKNGAQLFSQWTGEYIASWLKSIIHEN